MVNSPTGPSRARKDEKFDFISYIEDLKNRADIIRVAEQQGLTLNKHGQAECFNNHDQKTPSLKFYENTQSYHCFGCGSHGDVIGLLQHLKGCSFIDAVNELAGSVGMDRFPNTNGFDPEMYAKIKDCLNSAAEIYHSQLESTDPYLAGRGISCDTARCHLIGRTRGRDDLWKALSTKGIPADVAFLSGLVKSDFTDFFQDHIVVPIINRGTVVDFYGRLLNEDCNQRHWRLPNERVKIGHGLFNWNPRAEEIILVEGVFDALALIENGFDYSVATFGTNGLKEHHLRMIGKCSARKIFIAYDRDESGLGAALRNGYAVEALGKEARIVEVPDGRDPADFFCDNTAGDFEKLLSAAVGPLAYELGQIDPKWSLKEKVTALRNGILERCREQSPLDRAVSIKLIAKVTGLRAGDVRAEIESQKQPDRSSTAEVEVIDPSNYRLVRPALHIGEEGTLVTVPMLAKNTETGELRWKAYVITSQRETFPLERKELLLRGYYCRDLVFPERLRYSWNVIEAFLKQGRVGDLRQVHGRIRDLLRNYVDFADPTTYDYLACFIIATYFHPLFNYFPYLHFTGTKAVGKSKTLKILQCLCFNAILSVDLSDASQFRSIEALRPTLLLDETENLHERGYSERRALLLGGYEDGPSVLRTEQEGDTYRVREFENFGPRVFASIEGLENTLASRTVQIPMRRSYDDSIKQREVDRKDLLWEKLRSELFLVLMAEGSRVRELYQQMEKPGEVEFDSREYNLFKPILTIAEATGDPGVVQSVIAFANAAYLRKTDHYNDNADENILLRALLDIVPQDGWYSSEALKERIISFVNANSLSMEQALTRNRLGTLMTNMGLYAEKTRKKVENQKVTLYRLERATIMRIAENYEVDRPGQTLK